MENVFEPFSPILQYFRLNGLVPFTFSNHSFKISKSWKHYSHIIFFINFTLQIINQPIVISEVEFQKKLKLFVRICDVIVFPINSILSAVIIFTKIDILEDLLFINHFYRKNKKETDINDIKQLKYFGNFILGLCIALMICLNTSQCCCYIGFNSSYSTGQFIKCFAVITRSSPTLAMFGLYAVQLFIIRFCYKIINSVLRSIRRSSSGRFLSYKKHMNIEKLIRNLMIADYQMKDIIEKINRIYGSYNVFAALNPMIEASYVIVYNAVYYEDIGCNRNLSYFWVFYTVVLLFGSLATSVILRESVSF